jgi:hypothetical protein
LACTAILVPDQKDDGVVRCNNTEDCDESDDNRYVSLCVYGEGQAENTDKVCAPTFAEVSCDPTLPPYMGDSPFSTAWEAAQLSAAYVACEVEDYGKRGCPPDVGQCDEGLTAIDNVFTGNGQLCEDTGAILGAAPANADDAKGQDVKDRLCRSHFCDDTFVCDTNLHVCRACDPDSEFTAGGCFEVFIQGAPSSVYDEASCNENGNTSPTEAEFGPVP